jgi:hypothetical protein
MEARIGGKAHLFCSPVVSEMKAAGKKSRDWDLNDWNWDPDLLTASRINPVPLDCRSKQLFPIRSEVQANTTLSNNSSSCSDEITLGHEKGKRELEKRRRVVVVEDGELNDAAELLNLKLGGPVYPVLGQEIEQWEGKSGKKTKLVGTSSNRASCQVDDCRADLSSAKDYHRRHKVCDLHSKATRALVGSVMQRFCQQCSRFHILQEFDEGKRSCRRRLAGHNRRRRKTHPENAVNGMLNDERSSSYLLVSLLRILSNIHSSSDQTKDQDLLSHLLKNLASLPGTTNDRNTSGLQQLVGIPIDTHEQEPVRAIEVTGDGRDRIPPASQPNVVFNSNVVERRVNLNNIDLNSVYDDSQDCLEDYNGTPVNKEPIGCPLWVNKSSPPQTSGNTGSTSTQSPSSSTEEAQSRTDRIVFKLFGKDPSELPFDLRKQILDWLSHTPTDIESYIRPGCIILTIYLRMEKSAWEELYWDLSSSLRRLLEASSDPFWRTGWVYTRVHDRVAFVYNGQVVLDTPLKSNKNCRILSIKPIAVPLSERTQFLVKGSNLYRSTTRLLCASEGKYLVQRSSSEVEGAVSFIENEEIQSRTFPCSIPNVPGRGFIEVEDHGLSSSFFPFIVAEPAVCTEICTLESSIEIQDESENTYPRSNQGLDFIHEMGWLLHRNNLFLRLKNIDSNTDLYPFKRFKWLIEFSIDREWRAVTNKLLDILFTGTVDAGDYESTELALVGILPLHRAVQSNSRAMVDFLLTFTSGTDKRHLFRPDVVGPGGLTPLHVAACKDGSESVLDALTNDPESVGLEAWRNAGDSTGITPHEYAFRQGRYSYIRLIQNKINKNSESQHVIEIPGLLEGNTKQKSGRMMGDSLQIEKMIKKAVRSNCKLCEKKVGNGSTRTSMAFYRPAMLSMVAIAAVCVCVALLFKSSPEVLYVFRPFRWEQLKYGPK